MHPHSHATDINGPRTVTALNSAESDSQILPLNIAHKPGCADSVLDRSVFLCAHAIGMEKKEEMSPLAAAYQIIVKINYAAVNCPDAVTIINRLRNDSRLRVALRRAQGGWGVSHADSASSKLIK